VAAPPAPPASVITGAGSLKAHAAARGFLFGCAVNSGLLAHDESYASLVREQANIVVAENAMKWAPMRPAIDSYYFDDADALVAFAEKNKMKVRGHNLCWHRQLPKWFAGEATAANARGLLTEHIERVAGRYASRMHSWDVVNEAVLVTDGRTDGLRDSPWLKLIGADYIELAFKTARNADPQALLTYNDYGIEGEDSASEKKRAAAAEGSECAAGCGGDSIAYLGGPYLRGRFDAVYGRGAGAWVADFSYGDGCERPRVAGERSGSRRGGGGCVWELSGYGDARAVRAGGADVGDHRSEYMAEWRGFADG